MFVVDITYRRQLREFFFSLFVVVFADNEFLGFWQTSLFFLKIDFFEMGVVFFLEECFCKVVVNEGSGEGGFAGWFHTSCLGGWIIRDELFVTGGTSGEVAGGVGASDGFFCSGETSHADLAFLVGGCGFGCVGGFHFQWVLLLCFVMIRKNNYHFNFL